MNSFRQFGVLIFSICTSLTSQAACPLSSSSDISDGVLPLARQIPDRLKKMGLSKIGNFDIASFEKRLPSITYCVFSGGFATGSNGQRMSSVYLVAQKSVTFNQLSWQWVSSEARPVIAMHESLGALGFNDENYELSLALWYLSVQPESGIQKFLQSRMTRVFQSVPTIAKEHVYVVAGGVTGIGGGGDNVGLEAKMALWKNLDRWMAEKKRSGTRFTQSADDVMTLIQMSSFESTWDPTIAATSASLMRKRLLKVRLSAVNWNIFGGQYGQLRQTALQPILSRILKMQK